jgi:hypothetical protein
MVAPLHRPVQHQGLIAIVLPSRVWVVSLATFRRKIPITHSVGE